MHFSTDNKYIMDTGQKHVLQLNESNNCSWKLIHIRTRVRCYTLGHTYKFVVAVRRMCERVIGEIEQSKLDVIVAYSAASFILPLYCFHIKRPLLCKQQRRFISPLAKKPTNKCFISLIPSVPVHVRAHTFGSRPFPQETAEHVCLYVYTYMYNVYIHHHTDI